MRKIPLVLFLTILIFGCKLNSTNNLKMPYELLVDSIFINYPLNVNENAVYNPPPYLEGVFSIKNKNGVPLKLSLDERRNVVGLFLKFQNEDCQIGSFFHLKDTITTGLTKAFVGHIKSNNLLNMGRELNLDNHTLLLRIIKDGRFYFTYPPNSDTIWAEKASHFNLIFIEDVF